MSSMLRFVPVFLLPFQLSAGASATDAIPPRDSGATIELLTASVDRLAGLLEKELAFLAEEREARRVEVAVGIMGLRYQKIDRLEAEIRDLWQQEEEFARQVGLMKAQADQLRKQGRTESGEPIEAARNEAALLELHIKSEDERIAQLRERALVLEADVTNEKRRLANVEAVLDAWMEKQ